jgi:hypothetical protein
MVGPGKQGVSVNTEKKMDSTKLIGYLKDKWAGRPCPMCGHAGWSIQDGVYELREFHEGGMVIGGGALVPVVPVICSNCGNTILVNAILTGIVERGEKKNG